MREQHKDSRTYIVTGGQLRRMRESQTKEDIIEIIDRILQLQKHDGAN